MEETVVRPNYYKGKTMEVIDVIEDFDLTYNVGTAVAYLIRAGKKENNHRDQDFAKALKHIFREMTGKWA